MSDLVLVALISAVPATLGVLLSAYIAYTQRHLIKNTNSLVEKLVSKKGEEEYKRGGEDARNRPTP